MRVSHAYKFIFLAMPRTGSTSIRSILDFYSDIKSINIKQTTDGFPFYHHISAMELREIFNKRGWNWSEYRRFCVIRNPYDRIVSLYHHHLWMQNRRANEAPMRERKGKPPGGAPSFKDYVMRINPESRLTASLQSFICDKGEDFLVEDVLVFEKLYTELPNYLSGLGIYITSSDIPYLNASDNRGEYRAYYDEDTKERVAKLYNHDITRFGYGF
uniref:Sulfotransferase family protein n=1 Tax=Candidatus Kentrum sp. DK TaxID=2126562 RepID=A0A450T5X7_9GAMM|nr:MAG: Sulfotransferase family protein [Candidatus Kentron sp. DK]